MEEIVFHHTLPIQLRFNIRSRQQHCLFFFLRFGQDWILRFRMSRSRLGEDRHCRCPYRSRFRQTDLRIRPYRRTDCRFRSRNEKLSSAPTGDRHKDERDKMYLQINHGNFRPGETWVHASDGGMDRSDLQVWRQGFKKEEIKTYTSQYQTSSFQPYHIGKSWFDISHIYSRTPTGSESLFIIRV